MSKTRNGIHFLEYFNLHKVLKNVSIKYHFRNDCVFLYHLDTYSHGQELFHKFVSNSTNRLVKQLLSMTVNSMEAMNGHWMINLKGKLQFESFFYEWTRKKRHLSFFYFCDVSVLKDSRKIRFIKLISCCFGLHTTEAEKLMTSKNFEKKILLYILWVLNPNLKGFF